jgi:hypothetical protein
MNTPNMQTGDQRQSTELAFDNVIADCKKLILAKNHDYGEAWREMRLTSLTDQILIKVRRIKRLEELSAAGEAPMVSEGIEAEYRDILNYCVFALIKMRELNQTKGV